MTYNIIEGQVTQLDPTLVEDASNFEKHVKNVVKHLVEEETPDYLNRLYPVLQRHSRIYRRSGMDSKDQQRFWDMLDGTSKS